MNIWEHFGFTSNPYETSPIRGNEEGERLLVGRTSELNHLETALASSSAHPTIEGENGAGKTSVISVAGFRRQEAFKAGKTKQLIIPMRRAFQLHSAITTERFERDVLLEVAQAIAENYEILSSLDRGLPLIDDVKRWISSPIINTGGGGGASFAGFGASATSSNTPNTTTGFAESGFSTIVRKWLADLFPDRTSGGFLCVVDNLELLETSKNARDLLESLRDQVLNQQGLLWVLCGARGIIRSVASSSRLQGVIADPLYLKPIADSDVPDVIARRAEEFAANNDSYLPVEPDGFQHLYRVTNSNLRTALKLSQDFAMWVKQQGSLPQEADAKLALLEAWMAEQADRYDEDTRGVKPRAWKVFDQIGDVGGSISPSDYESFTFNSNAAMRPHIKSLEDAQLVDSAIDETDNRRRTIGISARGWIVRYKRSGYIRPEAKIKKTT